MRICSLCPSLSPSLSVRPIRRATIVLPTSYILQALGHDYLASLHDPSDEPLAHAEFSFDFERIPLNKQVLRQLLTSEMLAFHPDLFDHTPVGSSSVTAQVVPIEASASASGSADVGAAPLDGVEPMRFD